MDRDRGSFTLGAGLIGLAFFLEPLKAVFNAVEVSIHFPYKAVSPGREWTLTISRTQTGMDRAYPP